MGRAFVLSFFRHGSLQVPFGNCGAKPISGRSREIVWRFSTISGSAEPASSPCMNGFEGAMIDKKWIGYELPPSELVIERGRLQFFARSIRETDPIYTDLGAARRLKRDFLPSLGPQEKNAATDRYGGFPGQSSL